MRFKNITILLLIPTLLVSCVGSNYRPIVDTKGVDLAKYETDLTQCQEYAKQSLSTGESAAIGAAGGAVLGAVLGAITGNRTSARTTGEVGAVVGAVGGGAKGEENQRNIINKCLTGRGYKVLQ
jgi:uncharacterized protein YcfJ